MTVFAAGTVTRLYVTYGASGQGLTFIRINIPPAEQPKDNYFRLEQNHPNYNALYSLALSAAINRYVLRIRTESDITPAEVAQVRYLFVDW
jgi:hypothetical protein